jgi:hypothetical protein
MSRVSAAREAPRARATSGLWVQGLACGLLATLATPTALLAGLLLAPTGLAWLFDREPGHASARPVLLSGLAAAVHPLVALWNSGHTLQTSLMLAGDLSVLGVAWAAQAAGWLACELVPLLVAAAIEATASARARRLRAERAKLEEEWGLPPRTDEATAGSG